MHACRGVVVVVDFELTCGRVQRADKVDSGRPKRANESDCGALTMMVIGLDCATEDSKVGVALGEYEAGAIRVLAVEVCSRERPAASIMTTWLAGATQALLAIDAPLGWPSQLACSLSGHQAGATISASPNDMFRRETDRFIQRKIGKTPLDVGADRIARTAHAALGILGQLRELTGAAIPLAWGRDPVRGFAAIEVYPAATLVVHGFRSTGYKKPEQVDERMEILSQLQGVLELPADTARMKDNADVLDAVVCLLAAKDFLDGHAMRPVDRELAVREGWIWVAPLESGPERPEPKRAVDGPPRLAVARDAPPSQATQEEVVTNVDGLTAGDVIGKRVLCPACRKTIFKSWPGGWDAHVGSKCPGVSGTNEEARKADFKYRFSRLFR